MKMCQNWLKVDQMGKHLSQIAWLQLLVKNLVNKWDNNLGTKWGIRMRQTIRS